MKEATEDTICAISTAPGVGGIAVIRVSGSDALANVGKIWKGKDLAAQKSHTAHFGRILDNSGAVLDEVVATLFLGPNSFTGEDTVEIACHGSIWIQQQIVNRLVESGCRMATGGEFTQRAFLNGKMDLSQAEAIADVIASSSRATHRIAMNQMRGSFSKELAELREKLLEFVSLMELELDFSEEEVEFADRSKLVALAEHIDSVITRLADSFSVGNAIKNGIPVAIVGETNVGKSTLLNALLHEDRALVSDIHGTTRDVIEDTITIAGTLFRFIDTAGIRHTDDVIENMGIERTFKKLDEASVALCVIDPTTAIDSIREMLDRVTSGEKEQQIIAVINKIDKVDESVVNDIKTLIEKDYPAVTPVTISAKKGIGIDALQKCLINAAHLPENDSNEVIVTNARHYEALTHASEAIRRALNGLNDGISGDFVSQDIRECMHYLGEITGEITPSDILGSIFSKFCVGK